MSNVLNCQLPCSSVKYTSKFKEKQKNVCMNTYISETIGTRTIQFYSSIHSVFDLILKICHALCLLLFIINLIASFILELQHSFLLR